MKKNLFELLLTTVSVLISSFCFVGCGSDSDNGGGAGAAIPQYLIGNWYCDSNPNYDMSFSFSANGTGKGEISHKRIISISAFTYNYSYNSNGDIQLTGKRAMVDKEKEEVVDFKMTVHYDAGKGILTIISAPNGGWEGSTLQKSGGSVVDDYSGGGNTTGDNTSSSGTVSQGIYYSSTLNGYDHKIQEEISFGDWISVKETAAGDGSGYNTECTAVKVGAGDTYKWLYLHCSTNRPAGDAIIVETKTYSYKTNSLTAYYYLYEDGYSDPGSEWYPLFNKFTYSNGKLYYESFTGKNEFKKIK